MERFDRCRIHIDDVQITIGDDHPHRDVFHELLEIELRLRGRSLAASRSGGWVDGHFEFLLLIAGRLAKREWAMVL